MRAGTAFVCRFLKETYNVIQLDYEEGIVKIIRFELPDVDIKDIRDTFDKFCEYYDVDGGNVSFVHTNDTGDMISAVISD